MDVNMSIVNDTPTVVLLLVASLVIGCIFGSFLNVVIWPRAQPHQLGKSETQFLPELRSPDRMV